MDAKYDHQALLAKLGEFLSDTDRRRLHFLINDAISKKVYNDPTLGGTLDLLESLFDQGKINAQDFGHLIRAFREIGCHAAVKRLKEHQPRWSESLTTSLFYESTNDTGAMAVTRSKQANNISTPLNTRNRGDRLEVSTESENENMHRNVPNNRRSTRSRLTIFQIILLICNVIGIISLIILIVLASKRRKVIIVRVGDLYGKNEGGEYFDDSKECSLTFNERLIEITGYNTKNVLNYIKFHYSNKKSKQHGRKLHEYNTSPDYQLKLKPGEYINGVTIYMSTRTILDQLKRDEIRRVVGLRFHTNHGRENLLFGSDFGKEIKEQFQNYRLGYIRGHAHEYIAEIQFIWYSETVSTDAATLPTSISN